MNLLDKYGVPTTPSSKIQSSQKYRFIFHLEDFLQASLQTESVKIKYHNDPLFGTLHKTMEITVIMRDIELFDTFNEFVKYANICFSKNLKIEQLNGNGQVIKTIHGTIRTISDISIEFDYSKNEPVYIQFNIFAEYIEPSSEVDDTDE